MNRKIKYTLSAWALIIGLCWYGHVSDVKPKRMTFPKPDPTKGIPLGYDFTKKEYRYHSDNPRAKIKQSLEYTHKEHKIDAYDLNDEDIYDIMDYHLD